MGKKTYDDDVRFEDIDFDSSLDIAGTGFDNKPKSGGRTVVTEAGKSFLSDVSKSLTERSFARRWLGLVLPKGYSQLHNAYDDVTKGIGKIYAENEGELRPYMASANRVLTQRAGRFKNLLPGSIRDALETAESREKSSGGERQGRSDLDNDLSGLNDLFKLETTRAAEQKIDDQRKELKDDKKFRLSIGTSASMAEGIGRLVAYQDKILINYHRKNLEIGFRQFDVQRRLFITTEAFHKDALLRLESIQKNTGLPDYLKLTNTEALKERLRQRLADAAVGGLAKFRGDYFSGVAKATSGGIKSFLSQIGLVRSVLGGGDDDGMSIDKAALAGSTIGAVAADYVIPKVQYGAEHIADLLAPGVQKIPGLKKTGDRLRMALTDIPGTLNRYRLSDDDQTGWRGALGSFVKNLLPGYTPKDKIEGKGIEDLHDPAVFDNFFYNSITQVMPAYLESIDRTLRTLATGEEQDGQAWSVYTGSMVSRKTLDDQHIRLGLFRSQGNNIRQEVQELIGKMGGEVLSTPARIALGRRLLQDLQKGLGFRASDYIKPDSWPEVEDEVADELVDFFMTQFNLGVDGKPLNGDMSFQADILEAFTDSSNRIPKVLERAQVLMDTGIIGRDVLRRLGISQFGGVDHDFINNSRWTDIALGTDPLEAIRKEEKADSGKSKDVSEEFRRRMAEAEEAEREKRERARSQGLNDIIDTVQSPLGSLKALNPKITYNQTYEAAMQSKNEVNFSDLKDAGTHARLDKIFEKLSDLKVNVTVGEFHEAQKNSRIGDLAADIIESGMEKGRRFGSFAKEKFGVGKEKAKDLIKRAETFYKEDPRVRKVVDAIEKQYGKITDPERRAMLIQAVYKRTGTPEEILKYFQGKFEEAKEFFGEKYAQGKEYVGNKYDEVSDLAMSIYEDRHHYYEQAKLKSKEGLEKVKGLGKAAYDNRDKVIDPVLAGLERTAKWMDNISGIRFADRGTHRRLDAMNKILIASLYQQGWKGKIDDLKLDEHTDDKDEGGSEGKPGFFRRSLGFAGMLAKGLGKYFSTTYGLIGKGIGTVGRAAKGVLRFGFGRKTWGERDVHIEGEPNPRLYAEGLRTGKYYDVKTGKVITTLRDIHGEVRDLETNNILITQEEFENEKLVGGDGMSLARYLGRKGMGAARFAASMAAQYTLGAYGMMGSFAKKAWNVASEIIKDQLTQFDAYFPGETTPRINSKLMKKGHYFNEEGKVILSLDQIKGPVYDADGNEIISQEDIDKYGSLYARNGSLLFTFGRGLVSAGTYAMNLGLKAGRAYLGFLKKAGITALKFAGGLANRLTGGRLNKGFAADEDGYMADIMFEQLRIQAEILKTLKSRKGGEEVENDEDGDGIRDNSWADIMEKRAKRKARGANADVVEAINSLGDRLDGNFDELKEVAGKEKEGGWADKLKSFGSGLLGKIGLGSVAEKLAGKGVIRGTATLLGMGAKGAFFAAKAAVTKVAVPLAIGAGKVAMAALSAVGLPAVLIGATVGFIAYKGYQYYKQYKFDQKPLHYLRMMQYGVNPSDEKRVEAILQLETVLATAVKESSGGEMSFDTNKFDMRKVYEIFGLLKTPAEGEEPQDPSEVDQDDAQKLVTWLVNRFQPVYLRHLGALSKLANSKDLNKVDELITTRLKTHAFLDAVNLPNGKAVYNDLKNSPFTGGWFSSGKLTEGNNEVADAYKRIRQLATARPDEARTETTPAVPATPVASKEEESAPVIEKPIDGKDVVTTTTASTAVTAAAAANAEAPTFSTQAELPLRSEGAAVVAQRVEAASVNDLNRSLSVGSDLLRRAVDSLSSIDSTLKEINRGVSTLPERMQNTNTVAANANPANPAMTGDAFKAANKDLFKERPQRGNGSTRRQLLDA